MSSGSLSGWAGTQRGFQWLVVICVLIFAGLAAMQSALKDDRQSKPEVLPDRSVFNQSKPSGYGAWYQTLKQAKVPVTLWRKDFKVLIHDTQDPPLEEREAAKKMPLGFQPKTMVIIEPYPYSFSENTFTKNEVAMILYWVYMGNTVILLDPFERKSMVNLLKHLSLPQTYSHKVEASVGKESVGKKKDASIKIESEDIKPITLAVRKPAFSMQIAPETRAFLWVNALDAYLKSPPVVSEYAHFPVSSSFIMKNIEWPDDPLKTLLEKDEAASKDSAKAASAEEKELEPAEIEPEDFGGDSSLPSFKDFDLSTLMEVPYHPFVLVEDTSHHPVVIGGTYGQGQLILGTVSGLASNDQLFREGDQFQLMTNLVTSPGLPVLINEYVHGNTDQDSVFLHLGKTPLGIIYTQLIMLFCLVLWVSLNRWRPVLTQEKPNRENSSFRFLKSLSYLYYRTGATPVVLAPDFKKIAGLIEPHLPASVLLKEMDYTQLQQLTGVVIGAHVLSERDVDLLHRVQVCLKNNRKLLPKETLSLSLAQSELIRQLQRHQGDPVSIN
jgi:hypothetical protein